MNIREQLNQQLLIIETELNKFDWSQRSAYAWFLSQTFYYVRHSTRLLAMSSSRFGFDQSEQHYGFAAHIADETRHELLALNDLKALGFDLSQFRELPETRSWYHSQYYYIQNVDPSGLLGAVLALEGLSVFKGPWFHELITKFYGKSAATFVKVHATEDIHHIEGAIKGFEILKPHQKAIAIESLEQSVWGYAQMVRGIHQRMLRGELTTPTQRPLEKAI